jgi:glutamate-1-semialdehyde aminotransferase
LAESSLNILSAIREAIKRNLDEGLEFGEGGQARSVIAYDLAESSALDEVIRLAAGGSDVR